MLTAASVVLCHDNEPRLRAIVSTRPRKSPGTLSILRPKKSFNCVLAMTTAIPFVNPTTTGRGMKRTAVPRPVTPNAIRKTPASSVHM